MRLDELFNDGPGVRNSLRQAALDLLTPMVAHRVPFVTVQQLMDELKAVHSGIVVDRALILDLLNPEEVPAVQKIEGDRLYLAAALEEPAKSNDAEAARNKEHVRKTARQQAQKSLKSKNDIPGKALDSSANSDT